MAEENNQNLKDFPEEKAASEGGEPNPEASGRETKELLTRGEVKTMQKDISRLQEAESQKERGRISELKTEEEEKKEQERKEGARQAAEEREKAELAAKEKEEESKRLKEEREKKEEVLRQEESAGQGLKTEGFRERFREIQAREMEERRRFLEEVEKKATGQGEKPLEKPAEKPAYYGPYPVIPEKPSFFDKLWIRIVVGFLVLAILAGVTLFWYWYLVIRERTEEKVEEEVVQEELVIPAALIPVEKAEMLEITNATEIASALSQILNKDLDENQFTRVIIKNTVENKILGLRDFLAVFQATTPAQLYEKVDDAFTLFIYSAAQANRLGFVAEMKGTDLDTLLKSWEPTIENDLASLLVFLGKTGPASLTYFREAAYQDNVFRYLSLQPKNFGICWGIVNNYFIFTTSGESIIKTIDKIKSNE